MSPSLEFYFAKLLENQGAKDFIIVRDDAATSYRTRPSLHLKRKDSKFDSFSKLNSMAPSCPLRKVSSDDLYDTLRRSLHSKRQPKSNPKAKDILLDIVKHRDSKRRHKHQRTSKDGFTKVKATSTTKNIISAVTDFLEKEEFRRLNLEHEECSKHFAPKAAGI
jgi:hypothetical protein